jgi:hypothetical protein
MTGLPTAMFVATALGTALMAQSDPRGPLEGVWKVMGIAATGANAPSLSSPTTNRVHTSPSGTSIFH